MSTSDFVGTKYAKIAVSAQSAQASSINMSASAQGSNLNKIAQAPSVP
jgi:hypothetical protein